MEVQLIKTPQECIDEIKKKEWKDFQTLDIEVDQIVQSYGFKLSKKTGSKEYIYYICHLGDKSRTINQESRQRERQNSKCSNIFF